MNQRAYFLLAIAIISWASAGAAEPAITIRATPSSITTMIASDVTITVDVTAPTGSEVTFDPLGESLGVFEVIAVKDMVDLPMVPTAEGDAVSTTQRQWTRIVTLQTLSLGSQTIPPVSAGVQINEDTIALKTEPLAITVRSTLPPEEQTDLSKFRDIAGEIEIADTPTAINRFGVFAWGLAALIITGTGLIVFRRLRGRDRPLRWCQNRLQRLRHEPISQPHEFIAAVDGLKEVLLVATRTNSAAKPGQLPPQSTPHGLGLLTEQGFDDTAAENLKTVFNAADRLKFSSPKSAGEHTTAMTEIETASLRRAITDMQSWTASRPRGGH